MNGERFDKPRRKKSKSHKTWAYAYMPILYILLAALLIVGLSYPYWDGIGDAISVFSADVTPNTTRLTSIFTGPPETQPVGPENPDSEGTAEVTGDTVDNSIIEIPKYNAEYAHLSCERIGIDCPLYFGDSDAALANGAGQYHSSWLPGYGGTILVAGHNYSVFYNLQYAEIGDVFQVITNYGVYEYEVTDIQVHDRNDKSAYDLSSRDREVLVLYTCWPMQRMAGVKTDRLFVYCDKISGPTVVGLEG